MVRIVRATTIESRSSRQAAQIPTPTRMATRRTSPTTAAGIGPRIWPPTTKAITPAAARHAAGHAAQVQQRASPGGRRIPRVRDRRRRRPRRRTPSPASGPTSRPTIARPSRRSHGQGGHDERAPENGPRKKPGSGWPVSFDERRVADPAQVLGHRRAGLVLQQSPGVVGVEGQVRVLAEGVDQAVERWRRRPGREDERPCPRSRRQSDEIACRRRRRAIRRRPRRRRPGRPRPPRQGSAGTPALGGKGAGIEAAARQQGRGRSHNPRRRPGRPR